MCVVSNISDYWRRDLTGRFPYLTQPLPTPTLPHQYTMPPVTREEFGDLRKEIEELKKLLIAAKKFDEATGQPECEIDEKVDLIKKVAKLVGVDLSEVFGESNANEKAKPPSRNGRKAAIS